MALDLKSTFTPPPLDGSLDLLQIIEHNAQVNAAHPLFRYASANGAIETITWGGAAKAFDVAARFVLNSATFDVAEDAGAPPVVAILANLDSTITYYALVVGIMKAGFTAFPISTRNSADGVAHLLAKTRCKLLFTSNDAAIARLAEASCSIFEADNEGARVPRVVVPTFDAFYNASPEAGGAVPARIISDASTTPCVIIHSSGTVSFPKPIYLTYQMFFEHGNQVGLEGDLCGHIISTHGMPMFHLMGLKVIVYTALQGVILAVFRPSTPPVIPTPEGVLNAAVATAASRILCAPSFLEGWAKQKSSIDALKRFTAIMFGGGPIQVSVGDYLAKEGVTLVPMLGMTEVGTITTFFPKHTHTEGEGWEWFALDPNLDFKFVREDGADDIYRFIVKQNALKTLAVVNLTVDGVPAYDTGDLFIRHPTNPQLWKIYGRADEQIMHSSGEKTNPVPIEAGLMSSPYISGAIMFGRARFQTGVLIAPSPDFKFDITNAEQTKNYINLIWGTVEEVNRHAPQHSRIFKEMILIASAEKQFEYTPKGSIRRQITLKKYVEEIERLYKTNESANSANEAAADIAQGEVPKLDDFLTQVQTAVHTILGDSVGDDDDLFKAGADSLCALTIRNAIIKGLRTRQALSPRSIDALPADLLYYLPSISKISVFLYGAAYIDARDRNEHAKESESEVQSGVSDEEWQKAMESEETVVEIVKGNDVDEPPLIILHGLPGTVGPFVNMLHSPTKIWAVQLSDDAPVDTAEALVAFYYQKIKEKQPHGPYRLASYSGSCVIILELILTFESNGDAISQFIMLDHFPALFLCRLDLDAVELANPEWWDAIMKVSMEGVLKLFGTTKSIMAAQATVRIQELRDAMAGKPDISPMTAKVIVRAGKLMKVTMAFLLGERFSVEVMEGPNSGKRRFSQEIFKAYTSRIKSPLTVYFADEGIRTIIPPKQWEEFGPRMYFSNPKVVELEGGHIDFLGNEELLKRLKME